jgi:alpha-tubulin suppressor-like RCC1 family protein
MLLYRRADAEGKGRGRRAEAQWGLRRANQGAVAAWLAALLLAALLPLTAGALEPEGAVQSWGDNASGQLGRSGAGGQTPGAVPVEQAVDLTAGRAHSAAVLADGTLRTWGANTYGQLGNNSLALQSSAPASVAISGKKVASVSAGSDHTLALTTDGQVWAWGLNTSAQLALDPNRIALSRVPQRIALDLPAGVTITQVAAGDAFSLALASDGVVWGWGDNSRGQLGPALSTSSDGNTDSAPKLTVFPVRVGIAGVSAIGAGANHSLAITTGGQVWTWGDNEPMWHQVDLPAGAASPVAVDGGRAHSEAVLADGRVVAWGDNALGQLGRPATVTTGAPDFVPNVHDIAEVDTRVDTTVAVERHPASAAVWTWGANDKGQLGRASQLTNAPAVVSVSDTAITAASGDGHTMAALAPRAAITATSLTFPGSVEVGTTSAPLAVTVTNRGPGSLRIGTAAFQPGQTDYAFAATNGDGCSNKTLAANASCTVNVVFKPVAAGPRDSYLTIDHDGYGGDPRVDLHGQALVLSGGIGISTAPENVTTGVAASPSSVPLNDIPLQPLSPAVADEQSTGGLPLGDLTQIGGLPLGDLTQIAGLPLGDLTQIGGLPLGDLTQIGLPLGDLTQIGGLPLGDLTQIGGKASDFLGGITLASLPLANGYAWDGESTTDARFIVSGSPALHGQPLQNLTLLSVLNDATAAARFRAVPVRSVGWTASRLGGVGVLAFLLGGTPLRQIAGHDWCSQLNAEGLANCGAGYGRPATPTDGLSASAFEYHMAGLRLGALDLASVKISEIPAGSSAPVLNLLLGGIDLYRSDLGALAATSAVADCTKVNCTSSTLAAAQGAGAVKPAARLADLGAAAADRTLGRLMAGLLPMGDNAYGMVPLDRMGIVGYARNDGRDTHKFTYTATFANTSGSALPSGTTMTVKLPASFAFVPSSATMTVKNTAGSVVGGPVAVANPTRNATTNAFTWSVPTGTLPVANGNTLLLTFSARPGMVLGTFTVNQVSVQTPTKQISTTKPSAPVRVVDGLEPNDTPATATPMTTGELKVSHISSAGDRDFFRFDAAGIAPGSLISVHLDHQQGGDADLLLYGAPGMKGEAPLRAPSSRSLTPLAERKPAINGIGTTLQSDVQSDIHRDTTLPLLGMSQNRDTAGEVVTALALTPATANDRYVIEVVGYNGAFADTPLSVRVAVTPPPSVPVAPARTFPNPADPAATITPPSTSSFANINTLFVTANGRMQRQFGTTSAASITTALKDTRLAGIIGSFGVLSVDADDGSGRQTDVQKAYAAWDANPADPTKANDVVRAINASVDRLVVPNAPALQNIVVVGGDDVVPMARINDLTTTVNERLYALEAALRTSPANAVVGAAAAGRFLSDDGLADFDPTPMPDAQYLYLPSVALGRLVDTPAQITSVLNQFMQFGGVVDPKSALTTTSAGFLDDLADQVNTALAGKNVTRSTLASAAWGKAELASAWGPNPGIVSFNGHSDPSRTQARNGEVFGTADLPSSLARELVVSVGCHSGLPVADGVLKLPAGPAWASGLLGRGAAGYMGQTAYGLGSRSTVALSEKVVLGFVKSMGTTSLGNSLVAAKLAYAEEGGPADVLDAKALMQATYYGMPQLRFATAVPGPPPAPALSTGTDQATGLSASFLHAAPAFTKNVTADGTYYDIGGRTLAVAGRPVQPLMSTDVTRTGLRAHGLYFTGLTSTDVDGTSFDPVLPRPVMTGSASAEDELQVGDVTFPSALQSVRAAGARDDAVIVPALFQSTGVVNGKTVGHERRFTSLDATVLYSPVGNTDFTPPTVLASRAVTTTTGDAATFTVDAADAVDVTVLFKQEGSDTWRLLRLAPTGAGQWSGGARVTATKVEYFVQAVDAAGNVAVMANKGRLLTAQPIGTQTGSVLVKVTGTPTPANPTKDPSGWLATATVSLVPTDPSVVVVARVDGGPEKPVSVLEFAGDGVANPPAGTTRGDGHHVVSYAASDGSRGVIVVRIDNAGPAVVVANPKADGSSQFVVGQPATASYRCTDSASGFSTGCTGTVNGVSVADGGTLPTDVKPEHALVITATDLAGNTSTVTVPYQVGYRFDGFFEPVLNRPSINTWSAGQTIPLKWRLFDANDNNISALSTFVGAGSFPFTCTTVPAPNTNPGSGANTQTGLSYSGDKFQYGWATQKSWAGTCRRFVLRLDDGTFHLADFQFT